MRKVLIIDDVHPVLIERLLHAGFLVDYRPDILAHEVASILGDVEVLVVRSKLSITDDLLKYAPQLKLVARAGSGMDNILLSPSTEIGLVNAPEGNALAVAEHTLMLLLAMINHLRSADQSVRNFQWLREKHRGLELSELTVGIIGHGHVGGALANLLQPFGCRILAYDKYKVDFQNGRTEACNYEMLMKESDVITFHVPLTDETQGWMDEGWFNSLVKPIFLINAARGELLDLQALLNAIADGKIAGVALDVLPEEKLSTLKENRRVLYEKLFHHPQVLLTPHVAGWTTASYRKISEVLSMKILNYYPIK